MTSTRLALTLTWLTCGLALGCLGGARPEKAVGSALWLTPESGALEVAAQNRLAAQGLKEIYLDAAELDWSGDLRLRRIERAALPRRTPTTLVVHGLWLPQDHPPDGLATSLVSELTALRIEAEQSGILVVGFHFNVEPGENAESLGRTLGRLRTLLGKNVFVSARLGRKALEGPGAQAIADSVDYVVAMIYGQRPGEAEDPTAWDLQAVEKSFRQLEALRRPYFTGAITLGTASWRGRGGEAKGMTTAISLGELIQTRNLELKPGFSLLGIDRQVWEFVARGPAHVGDWTLATGDSIRVVRTATPFLEEFRRRVGAWESTHRLGDVFYRLRRESERLSLSVDNLAEVLAPDAAAPVLELAVEKLSSTERRWLVRLELANRSPESTDLALFRQQFRAATGRRRDDRTGRLGRVPAHRAPGRRREGHHAGISRGQHGAVLPAVAGGESLGGDRNRRAQADRADSCLDDFRELSARRWADPDDRAARVAVREALSAAGKAGARPRGWAVRGAAPRTGRGAAAPERARSCWWEWGSSPGGGSTFRRTSFCMPSVAGLREARSRDSRSIPMYGAAWLAELFPFRQLRAAPMPGV